VNTVTRRIRVGTAAWSDHQEFYPQGLKPTDRISYYARFFSVVEVNASYYHLLPTRNYDSWVHKTPDDFRFNVKAYGELTGHHRGDLAPAVSFEHFRESYGPLRAAGKLGAVLFQFPPWFEANEANRQEIARCAELMADDPLLIEFRNVSWLEPEEKTRTHDFLADLNLAYVTVDAPQVGRGTAPLVPDVTNPRLAYLRMHGRNEETWYKRVKTTGERFNYLYNERELEGLSDIARQLAEHAHEVHVIFNNNMQNYAVLNAREMMRLLDIPLVDPEADPPKQRSLGI
jgi:uncharacterized protein YecE (DUF72 family)